jgi:hypothetical protein
MSEDTVLYCYSREATQMQDKVDIKNAINDAGYEFNASSSGGSREKFQVIRPTENNDQSADSSD